MALLERHGIGNGKYKVGGSYPNSIFLDDSSKGRGQVLMQYTETESVKFLQSVEVDEYGDFYVGSRSGTNNLFKVSKDGLLLWEVGTVGSITRIKYDPYDDIIWVYDATENNVSSFDLEGNLLITIPYNVGTMTGLEVSEDYVILSNFGSTTTTNTKSVSFYEKNGNLVRDLFYQGVRSMYLFDNYLYVADINRLRKIDMAASPIWEATILNNTSSSNKMEMIKNKNGNLMCYNLTTGSTVAVNIYLIRMSNGEVIRSASKNSATITPPNNDDFPQTLSLFLLNNGKSNPVFISRESSGGTVLRYINEDFKITSRRSISVNEPQFQTRTTSAVVDKDFNMALVSNKVLSFIDPKEYFKIIE